MSGNRKYVKYAFDEEPAGDVFYNTYSDPTIFVAERLQPTEDSSAADSYYEAKRDQGKVQPSLVPFEAIEYIASIMTDALKENGGKYERDSWRTVPDGERRYMDAKLRHDLSVLIEGLLHRDEESGKLSIGHVATNAVLLLALALEQDKENQE